jgi:L-ascorbate 6-phosphate lactonase
VLKIMEDISRTAVPVASVRLWWLGQAGFLFKNHAGRLVIVDPYLSDAVERLHGFKRLSLAPLAAEEVRADLVVLSHEHTDHLDPDALPVIAKCNPAARFAAPAGCDAGLDQAGVESKRRLRLEPGRRYEQDGVVIFTARADHGEYSPTALCLVLDFGGVRVLYSGDTALRPELFQPLCDLRPDLALPCINGGFGNMTPLDAARLVKQANPQVAIPCHFWTFAEQGNGDPGGFIQACRDCAPDVKTVLLKPGEGFNLKGKNNQN